MTARYQGACLCGGVRFRVDGEPKWVANCHCSMCRRAHGAGLVAWVGLEKAQLHLEDPQALVRRYDSSAVGHRSFCGRCGSPLLFEGDRWPTEVHVALAAFAGAHGLAPKANAFFDDRAPWVHVDDGLPRRGGPDGTTPVA